MASRAASDSPVSPLPGAYPSLGASSLASALDGSGLRGHGSDVSGTDSRKPDPLGLRSSMPRLSYGTSRFRPERVSPPARGHTEQYPAEERDGVGHGDRGNQVAGRRPRRAGISRQGEHAGGGAQLVAQRPRRGRGVEAGRGVNAPRRECGPSPPNLERLGTTTSDSLNAPGRPPSTGAAQPSTAGSGGWSGPRQAMPSSDPQ
jgi:hypothetical protein